MNFKKTYGDIGEGFIHVHHIKPLSEIKEDYKVNPETELIQYALIAMLCCIENIKVRI